jgi:hypothetical protein
MATETRPPATRRMVASVVGQGRRRWWLRGKGKERGNRGKDGGEVLFPAEVDMDRYSSGVVRGSVHATVFLVSENSFLPNSQAIY